MRLGVLLALLGVLVVTACDDGAAVQNGESFETADTITVADDSIQVAVLPLEDQEAEPFDADAGASDGVSQDSSVVATLGGAPLVALGNGQNEPDELPSGQNVQPTPVVSEPGSTAALEFELDLESTILELVVSAQENDGDPHATYDIAAESTELETISEIVPVEPESDQLLFPDEAPEQLTGPADGGQALSGPADASVADDDELSNEQDFEAVSSRETIESDAQRLQAQEAERQEFAPTPVPERTGVSNVALFALQTTHDVGTEVYQRVQLFVFEAGVRSRCAEYADSEAAQQAFLDAGGPEKDELRIDPDGDGFVCGWDPNIYRAVLK